jgi:hypothetical protein
MSVHLLLASTEARPGEKLPFALVNDGPVPVSFGAAYALERDEEDGWIPCNVEMAWTAQLITLRPGGRHQSVASIPREAPPGRYRVSKQFERRDTAGKDVVAFEFDVVHR